MNMYRQSKAASKRWRVHTRFFPTRAGAAPISVLLWARSWRHIGPVTRSSAAGPTFRCNPPLRKDSRSRSTNAAKHGALSSPSGKVSLEWELGADALTMHWVENGGPSVAEPSSRSFGLKVIAASIEQQLG